MFGRLPRRYLYAIVALSITICVGAGLWLTRHVSALDAPWGTLLGLVVGVLAAVLLVHDFHRPQHQSVRPRHPR